MKYPEITEVWHKESNFLVILTVENEDALLDLLDHVCDRGIKHVTFVEPDLDSEHTAVALEPSVDAEKLVANLPLALREEALL